jgi:hypothetical protein
MMSGVRQPLDSGAARMLQKSGAVAHRHERIRVVDCRKVEADGVSATAPCVSSLQSVHAARPRAPIRALREVRFSAPRVFLSALFVTLPDLD